MSRKYYPSHDIPTIPVYNIEDFKDEKGMWVRSYRETKDGIYYQHFTRAGLLWKSLTQRAGKQYANSHRFTVNSFLNFQEFAEWCQVQHGYRNLDECGKHWHLDKDMCFLGNKVYSPETCCFIPAALNTALPIMDSSGKYLMGVAVNKNKITGCITSYRAGTSYGQETIHLGSYPTEEAAHFAWMLAVIVKLTDIRISYDLGEVAGRFLDARVSLFKKMLENREVYNLVKGS